MSNTVIADIAAALLRGYWNEIALDGKPNTHDPVKFRMGAWASPRSGYLGILSFDVLTGNEADPRRAEKGFIGLKLEPDPIIEIHMQLTKDTEEDSTMKRVVSISAKGVEWHVPVTSAPITASPALAGPQNELVSPSGAYRLSLQDDGNFVIYKMDAQNHGEAVLPTLFELRRAWLRGKW